MTELHEDVHSVVQLLDPGDLAGRIERDHVHDRERHALARRRERAERPVVDAGAVELHRHRVARVGDAHVRVGRVAERGDPALAVGEELVPTLGRHTLGQVRERSIRTERVQPTVEVPTVVALGPRLYGRAVGRHVVVPLVFT